MTLWEFVCAYEGYQEAHGVKKPSGREISEERLADMGIEGF